MISAQILKLQKDSEELGLFIERLIQRGDNNRANKFIEKKAFLDDRIAAIST